MELEVVTMVLLAMLALISGAEHGNNDVPSQADVDKYYKTNPPVDPAMSEVVITGRLKCNVSSVKLGNLTGEGYTDLFLVEYDGSNGTNGKGQIGKPIAYTRTTSPNGDFRIAMVKSCDKEECRLGKERITTSLAVWVGSHSCTTKGSGKATSVLLKRLSPRESHFPYEKPANWEWVDHHVPRYRPNTVVEIKLRARETDISERNDAMDWDNLDESIYPKVPLTSPNCTYEGICDPKDKEDTYGIDIEGMVYCGRYDRRAFNRAVRLYFIDPKKSNSAKFLAGSWSYASGNATSGASGTLHRADYHVCWRGCPKKQGLISTDNSNPPKLVLAVYHRCNEANFKSIKLFPLIDYEASLRAPVNRSRWMIDITDANDNANYFNRSYNHDNYWGAVGEAARVEL